MNYRNLVKIKKNQIISFYIFFLTFIYGLQLPLNRILNKQVTLGDYNSGQWVQAYIFVLISSFFLLVSLYFSITNKKINIKTFNIEIDVKSNKNFIKVVLIIASFFLWSAIMFIYRTGITIYNEPIALPFRLNGILYYGRLFIQPLFLSLIANLYRESRYKYLISFLFFLLGIWVCITSGSRFIAILFSLPIFFLLEGKKKYFFWLIYLLIFIFIASLTRNFVLPYLIGGDLLLIYANNDYQSTIVSSDFWLLPINTIVVRSMGISKLLLTLDFGNTTSSFLDSFSKLLSAFFPYLFESIGVSIWDIYGVKQYNYAGVGLDLFSNLWMKFGGRFITYIIGLNLTGLLVGKIYENFSIILYKFKFETLVPVFSIMLFLIIFEGRIFLLPFILLISYFSRTKSCIKLIATFLMYLVRNESKMKKDVLFIQK